MQYNGSHRRSVGTALEADCCYDALSKRISKTLIQDGQQLNVRYGWDGDRLVNETTDDISTTIIYEPDGFVPMARIEQALAEKEKDQATEEALTQLRNELIKHDLKVPDALKKDSGEIRISLFVTDHLGTPQRLLNEDGETVWEARPDDWGAAQNQKGVRQPIRFQGQWEDEESGLFYNRYRYYDPMQGRYVTQDPIGLNGGKQYYQYGFNQPTSFIDGIGLEAICPASPSVNDPSWKPYEGISDVFIVDMTDIWKLTENRLPMTRSQNVSTTKKECS